MLVYGDGVRSEPPREKLAAIVRDVAAVWGAPPGIVRHGELVAVFIAAGELAQGLADLDFERLGVDARSATNDAAMRLLIGLARAVGRSWSSGFCDLGESPLAPLHALQGAAHPEAIDVSRPEGYAFYALYPEAYIAAAKALAGRPVKIIGLRSIGTGLAAAVAAGSGQDDAVTVRPAGHPFRRALRLSDGIAADLLSDGGADFAVVDEGPGLSGSSFGCVADFLEDRGVERRRIHFFPSHQGPLGPEASARHRARWDEARRHVVDFDDLVLRAPMPAHRLESWVADLVGEAEAPTADLSGGAWRKLHFRSEADWPPANTQQERRKFLLRTAGGPWLLKFAGLGRYGAGKVDIARALASAGFAAPVAGFRHGFIVERWLDDARPLRGRPVGRRGAIERIGHYIGFRAKEFPADRPGASLEKLAAMASRNVGLALGEGFARTLAPWNPRLERLTRHVRPVRTDNRLHPWEWLISGDRLVKADGLDHHAAHDLVGCQDIAWDIAGAAVELDLGEEESERLCTVAEREAGRAVAPELVDFLNVCYLAFQLGAFSLAADAHAHDPAEAARLRAATGRYTDRLRRRLAGGHPALAPSGMGEASCA
ncbi:MAG TPA: hypothetical protein VF601_06580 [Beijerinckiaceae bacterium]|jgi:hypothetical protein